MTPTYDTDLGQFLRTFNIRFEYDGKVFETPIKAVTWLEAEDMLDAIKATGMINSELIEIIE
jgi:hypothetical protein